MIQATGYSCGEAATSKSGSGKRPLLERSHVVVVVVVVETRWKSLPKYGGVCVRACSLALRTGATLSPDPLLPPIRTQAP